MCVFVCARVCTMFAWVHAYVCAVCVCVYACVCVCVWARVCVISEKELHWDCAKRLISVYLILTKFVSI